ncbi:MAG: hypothetical protein V3T24_05745, partial [Longimicrobiales bacterium]
MLRSGVPAVVLMLLWPAAGGASDPSPTEEDERPRPRLALALSGGGARGIAHIGALRALEEAGI